MFYSSFTILLAGLASLADAALTNTGRTVNLNNISYYVPPAVVGVIPTNAAFGRSGLVPLTIVNSSTLVYTTDQLNAAIPVYTAADDVFQTGFLQGEFSLISWVRTEVLLTYT